ncbi:MAG: hypothetical protein LHV69_05120 [Elusimicrobia bacterium]|nr:hypothetical protein [Candidatus Obscuribacterium magneticum]
MTKKVQLILDTSLFVNPACAHVFGHSPTSALTQFLEKAKEVKNVDFLMPPSVYAELMHFAEEPKIPKSQLLLIHKRAPKKHELRVPGIFLYQLVDETRDRVDRGLRLAERHVREALQISLGAPHPGPLPLGEGARLLGRMNNELPLPTGEGRGEGRKMVRPDAEIIGRLRDSYRRMMREGMLDSKADVDLLLLTYEVEGTLATGDIGLQTWAENLGLTLLSPEHLPEFLEKHL